MCSVMWCDVVFSSVLQRDAMCCSVLQCDAVSCSVLQHALGCETTRGAYICIVYIDIYVQCVAEGCNICSVQLVAKQHVWCLYMYSIYIFAVCSRVLQCVAV
jgi:hypothetical protein